MLTLLFAACTGDEPAATNGAARQPPSRFDAVHAAPQKQVATDDFCEVKSDAATAKTFVLPPLDGAPMASSDGWTWVNVWATWCGPCIAEMPMLVKWQERLSKDGLSYGLSFLSVDAKADELAKWQATNKTSPPTMHLAKMDDLSGWLTTIGLDASAVLPIHLFVDPDQKIRCVRMGGIGEAEYDVVKKVLSGG